VEEKNQTKTITTESPKVTPKATEKK
jgi:hypothetical protein